MIKYKTIDEFLADLATDKKEQVRVLQGYIKAANPSLEEHIKWNARATLKTASGCSPSLICL